MPDQDRQPPHIQLGRDMAEATDRALDGGMTPEEILMIAEGCLQAFRERQN